MKKKRITNSWTIFTMVAIVCWIVFIMLSVTGCTLHFKADKLDIETKPPEAKIGNNVMTESDYRLVAADILKPQ